MEIAKKQFRFRLRLNIPEWGMYKKGDIETFYINLLDENNGLCRFPIDPQWDIVSCDMFIGMVDKNGVEIFENDVVLRNGNQKCNIIFKGGAFVTDSEMGSSYIWSESNIEVIGNKYDDSL